LTTLQMALFLRTWCILIESRRRCSFCLFAAFNRCLLDRVIDIVIQCLRHNVAETSKPASSLLLHQTCHGSALSSSHLCSSGAACCLLFFYCTLLFFTCSCTVGVDEAKYFIMLSVPACHFLRCC